MKTFLGHKKEDYCYLVLILYIKCVKSFVKKWLVRAGVVIVQESHHRLNVYLMTDPEEISKHNS